MQGPMFQHNPLMRRGEHSMFFLSNDARLCQSQPPCTLTSNRYARRQLRCFHQPRESPPTFVIQVWSLWEFVQRGLVPSLHALSIPPSIIHCLFPLSLPLPLSLSLFLFLYLHLHLCSPHPPPSPLADSKPLSSQLAHRSVPPPHRRSRQGAFTPCH